MGKPNHLQDNAQECLGGVRESLDSGKPVDKIQPDLNVTLVNFFQVVIRHMKGISSACEKAVEELKEK
jgi:hypothetical protein